MKKNSVLLIFSLLSIFEVLAQCPGPTGLQITSSTNTSISVSWNAGDPAVTVYRLRIRQSQPTQSSWSYREIPITQTSYTLNETNYSAFIPGNTYQIQNAGWCGSVSSNFSSSSQVFHVLPCDAPANLSVGNITKNTAELSWAAGYGPEFEVRFKETALSTWTTVTDVTINPYTVAGLRPETSYDVEVKSECTASTNSSSSSTIQFNTEPGFANLVEDAQGNIGIGTTTPQTVLDVTGSAHVSQTIGVGTTNIPTGYSIAVKDGIIAEKVRVAFEGSTEWPDYVFQEDFELMTTNEIAQFILANGHLPNVPSAKEIKAGGIDLGEMDAILLRKIEELTLMLIEQQKVIAAQGEEIEKLKLSNPSK